MAADPRIIGAHPAHHVLDDAAFQAHVIDKLGEIHERVETLADNMPDARQLQQAVAAGTEEAFSKALSNPDNWNAAMKGISRAAQTEAGGWLFSGIRTALSRLAWVVLLGVVVYQFGGWTALTSIFKQGGTP